MVLRLDKSSFLQLISAEQLVTMNGLIQKRVETNAQVLRDNLALGEISVRFADRVSRAIQAASADCDFIPVSLAVVASAVNLHIQRCLLGGPDAPLTSNAASSASTPAPVSPCKVPEVVAVATSSALEIPRVQNQPTLVVDPDLEDSRAPVQNVFLFNSAFPPSTPFVCQNMFASPKLEAASSPAPPSVTPILMAAVDTTPAPLSARLHSSVKHTSHHLEPSSMMKNKSVWDEEIVSDFRYYLKHASEQKSLDPLLVRSFFLSSPSRFVVFNGSASRMCNERRETCGLVPKASMRRSRPPIWHCPPFPNR